MTVPEEIKTLLLLKLLRKNSLGTKARNYSLNKYEGINSTSVSIGLA